MEQGMNYRAKLQIIRAQMNGGVLTYEQAEQVAQPILDIMNSKGAAIAKKYGKRFNKSTFGIVMR